MVVLVESFERSVMRSMEQGLHPIEPALESVVGLVWCDGCGREQQKRHTNANNQMDCQINADQAIAHALTRAIPSGSLFNSTLFVVA